MSGAITQLNYNPAAIEMSGANPPADLQPILQGTYLRDILLRSFVRSRNWNDYETSLGGCSEAFAVEVRPSSSHHKSNKPPPLQLPLDGLFRKDARIQSWAKRYSSPDPVVIEGDPVLEKLNPTQVRAVAMMLDNRFTLVQGVRPSRCHVYQSICLF